MTWLILFLCSIVANSATITSTQNGDWSDGSTWVGGAKPADGDDVVIAHDVVINENSATISSLNIQIGNTLQPKLLNGRQELHISGDFTIAGTFNGVNGVTNFAEVHIWGTSNINVTGTIAPELFQIESSADVTLQSNISGFDNNTTLEVDGILDCDVYTVTCAILSTFNLNAGATLATDLAGGIASAITGAGSKNYDNDASYLFGSNVTNTGFGSISNVHDLGFDGCTITTTSDITISGRLYEISAALVNTLGDGDTWTLTGNETGDGSFQLRIDNLSITGNYTNIGRFRIGTNLVMAPSSSLSTVNNLTYIFNNNCDISNAGTLTIGTIRPNGTLTSDGDIRVYDLNTNDTPDWTHSSGTITLLSTIENNDDFDAGSYDFANLNVTGTGWTSTVDMSIQDDVNVTGSFIASSGEITLVGNSTANITGAGTITFNNLAVGSNYNQSASAVSIAGNIDLGANTYDVNANALDIAGDIVSTTGNIDLTDDNSTLRLSGSGAITIGANEILNDDIGNLILTKSNSVIFSESITVVGDLTMNNASLDVDLNGINFNLFGDITYNAGKFNNTGQFFLWGTGDITLPDMFLNNEIEGFISRRDGVVSFLDDLEATLFFEVNSSGSVDMTDQTLTIGSALVITAGELNLTDDASTLVFDNTGTTIANDGFTNGEIGNLTLQRSTTTTLVDDLTIDGVLTLDNASTVLDIDNYNLTIGNGITYNSGSIDATDNSSTLTINGSTAINLNANALVNDEVGDLVLNLTSTVDLNDNLTVDGDVTIGSGFNAKIDVNSNTMTFNGNMIRPFGSFGFIDAQGTGNVVVIGGTGNVTMDDFFFGSQVTSLIVEKNGIFAFTDSFLTGTLRIDNPNADIDMESGGQLTVNGPIDYVAGTISAETDGKFIFLGGSDDDLDIGMFDNQRIYELELGNNQRVNLKEDIEVVNDLILSSASATFDLEANQLTVSGTISDATGSIDADNDASTIVLAGTGALEIPVSLIANDEVGNLTVTRTGGTTSYPSSLTVDGTLTLNNSGQIFDVDGILAINGLFTITSGTVDLDNVGDRLLIASSAGNSAWDSDDFQNGTLYNLYIERAVTWSNDLSITNDLNIINALTNFQTITLDIAGNINLSSSGSFQSATNGLVNFVGTTTITNGGGGTISLYDIDVSGNLNYGTNITVTGDIINTGTFNNSGGITTFSNAAQRTITNSGTLDFNNIVVDNGSEVTTVSDFDLNGDITLSNATSVFTATTPSNLNFTKENAQINLAADSDGSTSGLTFYNLSIGAANNIYTIGAFDIYINGDYYPSNSRLNMAAGSNLIFTDPSGLTDFGYLDLDDLTFESTSTFTDFNIVIHCDGDVTVDAGADILLNSFLYMDDNDNTIVNSAPNDYENLEIARLVIDGITTTSDDFSITNSFEVAASSTFNQTAGTVNFKAFNPTVTKNSTNAEMILNDVRVEDNPTSTADILINGDFRIVGGGDSWQSSAGSITFTNTSLDISNNGTLEFFDVFIDNTVTGGSSTGDITILNNWNMVGNAYFTATPPSLFNFTASTGELVSTANADGASVGLTLDDVDFSGDYTSVGAFVTEYTGNFTVSGVGSFLAANSSTVYLIGSSGTISNGATLDFANLTIGGATNSTYTTGNSFDVNGSLYIEDNGFFNATAGEILFDGASNTISNLSDNNASNLVFNDIESSSDELFTSSSYTVLGNLTLSSSGDFTHTNGGVIFSGGNTHLINNPNGELTFYDFYVNDEADNIVETSDIIDFNGDLFTLMGSSASFFANDGRADFLMNSGTINNSGSDENLQFYGMLFNSGSSVVLNENQGFKITENMSITSEVDFSTSGSVSNITFNGTTEQELAVSEASVTFMNLILENDLRLNGSQEPNDLQVHYNLHLDSANLDLNGANILSFIPNNAQLIEDGGYVVNSDDGATTQGHLYYATTFNNVLITNDIIGLGIGIKQIGAANPLGSSTFRRYHGNLDPAGGLAIDRFYEIDNSNDEIDARIVLNYRPEELNDIPEDKLLLLSTNSRELNWAGREATIDSSSNRANQTDTVDQFASFSRLFTLGEPILMDIIYNANELVDTVNIPNHRLIAGEEYVVMGFDVISSGNTDVTGIKLFIDDNSENQYSNFKLFLSNDDVFSTTDDNIQYGITVSNAIDSLEFTDSEPISASDTLHYFLTTEINYNVTINSPRIFVSVNQSGITTNAGIVNINELIGPNFGFQQRIDAVFNPLSLDEPTLYPKQTDLVVYGFQLVPLGNQATLKSFDLNFGNELEDTFNGELKLYSSIDNDFDTESDNQAITLTNTVNYGSMENVEFLIEEELLIDSTGHYFFVTVDSVSNTANYGSPFITPSLPQQSLTSSEAAPVATDSVKGFTYDFGLAEVEISSYNLLPSSVTISQGVRNQQILAIDFYSQVEVELSSISFDVNLDGIASTDFQDFYLYYDENSSTFPDTGEQISIGTISNNTLVFDSQVQNASFTGSARFIVTTSPRNSAPVGGSIQLNMASNSNIIFESPGVVTTEGPFTGSVCSVGSPSVASIVGPVGVPNTIISGSTLPLTIIATDSRGLLANLTSQEIISIQLVGGASASGELNGSIANGEWFNKFDIVLTTVNGDLNNYFRITTTNFGVVNSSTFNVLNASPNLTGGNIALSNGSPAINSIDINSWTFGNGDGRIIVARQGAEPVSPSDGIAYSSVNNFNSVGAVGTNQTKSGSVVVVNDSNNIASQVSLSNLVAGKTYYFKLFEYNLTNGIPVYNKSDDLITYSINTEDSDDPFTGNSTPAASSSIPDDTNIDGVLNDEAEEDWYNFYNNDNNIIITNCGKVRLFELYKLNSDNEYELVRTSQNGGDDCTVLIINNAEIGLYFIRVAETNEVIAPIDYEFEINTFNNQIYSQKECNCP